MNRFIAFILALALLFTLAACSKNKASNNTTDGDVSTGAQTEAETEPDAVSVLAGMPDADYGGYEFRIFAQNWVNSSLFLRQYPDDEMDGEPINDALYKRDSLIEDKYKHSYYILRPRSVVAGYGSRGRKTRL